MTNTKSWARLLWRVGAFAMVLAVLATIATLGWIRTSEALSRSGRAVTQARTALADAQHAAATAQATANCLNRVLADRNQPTVDETNALKAFATIDSTFKSALGAVLLDPKAEQAHGYVVFLAALRAAAAEGKTFAAAEDKVMAERARAPLGAC